MPKHPMPGPDLSEIVRRCPVCHGDWPMASYKTLCSDDEDGILWSDVEIICPQGDSFTLVKAVRDKFCTREEASISYVFHRDFIRTKSQLVKAKDWEGLRAHLLTVYAEEEADLQVRWERGDEIHPGWRKKDEGGGTCQE
jgi:hypothetical protein